MDEKTVGTAIYLVGHGSKTKPRLIELQHQRILRYRRALFRRYDIGRSTPTAFIDLHLPSFGMGKVDLMDVPQYTKLLQQVDEGRFGLVFIDVDENPGLTPDYESAFVRSMLVAARATAFLRRLPMNMTTSTRQVSGVTIVDISGRIVLGEEGGALRELVCDLLSNGHNKILLNLGAVNYIDSSGLGHLVSALTRVRKQAGELKLLNLTIKVRDLMQIARLYTVFDIIDDEAAAVKSFAQSAAAATST
jgi:anti-sigma B factor antagonist